MDTSLHLYESLATRLSEAIHAGTLRAGDRLPSVRRLSTQHRVSIATAVQAYRHLDAMALRWVYPLLPAPLEHALRCQCSSFAPCPVQLA